MAHTLPPRIPCARCRGRQHCDHVANFWRDQPAFIPYKTQSFLKLVRYVRMRTSSSLEPAGDVLIAGLTVELLYGIFSLLSRKSEMVTVEKDTLTVIGIQIGYQVHCVQVLDWHPDRVLRVLHQLLSMEYSGFT